MNIVRCPVRCIVHTAAVKKCTSLEESLLQSFFDRRLHSANTLVLQRCSVMCTERDKDGMSSETPTWSVSRLQSSGIRQRLLQPVQRQEMLLCTRILSARTHLQRSVCLSQRLKFKVYALLKQLPETFLRKHTPHNSSPGRPQRHFTHGQ